MEIKIRPSKKSIKLTSTTTFTEMFLDYINDKLVDEDDRQYFLKITNELDRRKYYYMSKELGDIVLELNQANISCEEENLHFLFSIDEIRNYMNKRQITLWEAQIRSLSQSSNPTDTKRLDKLNELLESYKDITNNVRYFVVARNI